MARENLPFLNGWNQISFYHRMNHRICQNGDQPPGNPPAGFQVKKLQSVGLNGSNHDCFGFQTRKISGFRQTEIILVRKSNSNLNSWIPGYRKKGLLHFFGLKSRLDSQFFPDSNLQYLKNCKWLYRTFLLVLCSDMH